MKKWKSKKLDAEEEESEKVLQELETLAMRAEAFKDASAFAVIGLVKFARIEMAISRRAHKQTRHIIWLTWSIVLLTFALLSFTIYLSYDAYLKDKSHEEQYHSAPKPDNSPPFDNSYY